MIKLYKKNAALVTLLFFLYKNGFCQSTYFQQQADYTISVSLDDSLHTLSAFEKIEYTNNATVALSEIYFHLWPNAFKNNSTALAKEFMKNGNLMFYNSTASQRGYIDSLQFKVDGENIQWSIDSTNIEICKLTLKQPLLPQNKIIITTPFFVKIPDAKFSRLGHVGQSYMISQWYPKPVVYDNTGWHPMQNVSQGEFYSEFGSFDITITVPENYVVAATGNLQNPEEIEFLNKKVLETQALKEFSKDKSFPSTARHTKTITYKQSNIHDFAWFADKRFHVLSSQVELPYSKRIVKTYAYFTNSRPQLWQEAPQYIDSAVYFYSKWNGDYPYETCSAVDGTISAGGGMEYPTITVIGITSSAFELEDVIAHEVGHNWFYGILGSNEREHAWMDEGINTFNETRYIYTKMRKTPYDFIGNYLGMGAAASRFFGLSQLSYQNSQTLQYLFTARSNNDQKLNLRAEKFWQINYGVDVYSKTGLIFEHLKAYLGDSLFDVCMQTYFEKWKFKHPKPDDLQKVFEETSGKKLNWVFNDLINTKNKIDYKIASIKKINTNEYNIKIKNAGRINSPVSLSSLKNSNIENTQWFEGFNRKKSFDVSCSDCDAFRINANDESPELYDFNNTIRTKGLLKKFNPIKFYLIGHAENKNETQISCAPLVGYNAYDGFMAGAIFHNIFLLEKKFEYSVAPMYGLESNSMAGSFFGRYNIFINYGVIDRVALIAQAHYFSDYNLKPNVFNGLHSNLHSHYLSIPFEISGRIKKSDENFFINNFISLKTINLWNDVFHYDKETPYIINQYHNFNQLTYTRVNDDKLDPSHFLLTVENGEKYFKTFFELKQEVTVGKYKKALQLRLFAGTFLQNKMNEINSFFKLSGWKGTGDYLFNEYYFGRNETEGLWKNQFLVRDGGLKTYYPLSTDKWMISINASYKLPIPLVKLFFDVAALERGDKIIDGADALKFDGGICISVIKNSIEIYLPLFYSTEINKFYELNNYKFQDKIRFVFDLKNLNPVKLRGQIQ